MKLLKAVGAIAAVVVLQGCAHTITVSPDVAKLSPAAEPIQKAVGYYISDAQRAAQVTTPGGGGDKVRYTPYKDIETAFYKTLSNTFKSVTVLSSPTDADAIAKNNLSYVIVPQIVTDSSSPSPLTWPPTRFTVEMTCTINDAAGNPVLTKTVSGEGKAEFEEFKHDFSLSARRGAEDALVKLQAELLAVPELRK